MFLECCKSSPSSLPSLLSSNVSHIELCSAESLAVGGTTPTPGMLNCCVEQLKHETRKAKLPSTLSVGVEPVLRSSACSPSLPRKLVRIGRR